MRVSVRRIQEVVARYYGLSLDDLIAPSRKHAGPRHEAMYLATTAGKMSLPNVGKLFGDRHHTTVLYARRAVEKRIADCPRLGEALERLATKAAQTPAPVRGSWSQYEIETLKIIYPKRGAKGVVRKLPHRTIQGVWAKAGKLGVVYECLVHPLINFPRECKQCGMQLHYSKSAKYLHKEPTGLCRKCCNRRPRSEETLERHRDGCIRASQNLEIRARQQAGVRAAMVNLSAKERQARRERGRLCGLSNRGNQANPAGSLCRMIAGKKSAETKRAQREAARIVELRRPRTFEEKLQAVLEGRATIVPAIRASNDPEYTLGGVSGGWAA